MLFVLTPSNINSTISSTQTILTISDAIQLCGILLSTFVSIIAIVISVITLRQNNRMIEESTRPAISIYFDYSQMGTPTGYFVIKNFGASAAIITSLSYNDPIKQHPTSLANLSAIFDSLVNNTIAPNQSFLAPFKLYEYTGGKAIFDIAYNYK